jgi:hypothetical protein
MIDGLSTPSPDLPPEDRSGRILDDLQDAVQRMHVLRRDPRLVVANGSRGVGARPMAWQVLFERSFGQAMPSLVYRGTSAATLPTVLLQGFDQEPTLEPGWSHARLGNAWAMGPVIQAFRADRLPDDVSRALVGVLIFEEDGLSLAGIRALTQELWASPRRR